MTILVAGAGGQLGHELVLRGAALGVVGLDHGQWDVSDPAATARIVAEYRPRVVINAAAHTAVDKAEGEPERALAVNRDGVRNLARACAAQGAALLHLSTCYVFDGAKGAPYTEDDAPHPLNVYGRSKWEGERLLPALLPRHLTLRVSWVFGAHGGNFVRTMLRLAGEGRPLRVVADQTGTPTHAGDIARALLCLAARIQDGEALPWGTYHYPGGPATTWHGFAQAIMARARDTGLLDTAPPVAAIGSGDYPAAARRPRYSVLDGTRGRGVLGLEPADWRAGLQEVLSAWKDAA
ncbi:dTDP-4-dehydrorhamnose reductase [Pigmentiphaga sp. NML030171]|uniref:dTDP-4-dehydrorhamnose reductase n=1 Tax=Pigmentiphaga sp. NML030171 TaxID=2008676 RepID=UPI000B40BA6E|nr:dTDP-4-dehydrorhamnose reductase [Pigmentiphaga sp. NML030171]OVZ59881.1 dTDP-4-dehydrorhamnose reductase [Pigmentiphaga sp. NML030171]